MNFSEERSKLHKRIESRQGKLVGDSLLEEINEIKINFDISSAHPAMKAINYKQGLDVIEGKIEKSELFAKSLLHANLLKDNVHGCEDGKI